MTYLMDAPTEAARIRGKTSRLLIRHHLDWIGLAPGESFVDFGCATGEVLREAAALVGPAEVLGIDASADMLECARVEARRQGVENIAYHQAEVTRMGSSRLPSNRYDHAWTRFFLEYQPKPVAAVSEMARVVRTGGRVNLIDIDGNCLWHFPSTLSAELDEIAADLRTLGFDPHIGRRLGAYAEAAGLVDVRESVEPYHYIVGAPDAASAAAWRLKIETLRDNYVTQLFPHKASKASVFDDLLRFLLDEGTMTWSLLHLVQATKPDGWSVGPKAVSQCGGSG